jgi:hypothetical protein
VIDRLAPGPACGGLLLFVSSLPAQAQADLDSLVTESRVREVVTWIASDERAGRDSPSPGLEATARWLAERFERAGLEQVVADSWRHEYVVEGSGFDSSRLTLTVVVGDDGETGERRFELVGPTDVRLHRPGAADEGQLQDATAAGAEDARIRQLLNLGAGRQPILLQLPENHPQWQAAGERQQSLRRRLRGSSPVFLIRQGAMAGVDLDVESCRVSFGGAAAEPCDVGLANVVGVLRGATKPDEYVVVSAHYDHIGTGRPVGGDAIYNGADDDATGTTAVVLLAEALTKMPRPRRSIVFVCFSAEEKGLLGSREFVADDVLDPASIVANVNIEMIGRPPEGGRNQAWITGRQYSDFESRIRDAMAVSGVSLVDFARATALFGASDNLSFVRRGVVAHSISAGSLHEDYHKPSDEVSRLDLEHMTTVIRALGHAVLSLANDDGRPAYNDEGRTVVERMQKRRR